MNKEKLILTKRRCNECEDYTQLLIDGNIVTSGDYYHDKIDERIDGWEECLQYLDIKFEVIEDENFVCEYCGE